MTIIYYIIDESDRERWNGEFKELLRVFRESPYFFSERTVTIKRRNMDLPFREKETLFKIVRKEIVIL